MRTLSVLVFLMLAVGAGFCAGPRAIPVSMCTIDRSPSLYNGKMVQVRGLVARAEGLALYVDSKECHTAMALRFPEGATNFHPGFRPLRDDAYRKFMNYVQAPAPIRPKAEPRVLTTFVAPRYCDIRVTIIGRFEAVSEQKALRGRGFGNAGASPFQLIVQSVVNSQAKECAPPIP